MSDICKHAKYGIDKCYLKDGASALSDEGFCSGCDLACEHLDKVDFAAAIKTINSSRQTHVEWACFFGRNPDKEKGPEYVKLGGKKHHLQCIRDYDNVLAVLAQLSNLKPEE